MTALFIMPHYSSNFDESIRHLEEAIGSLLLQTDNDWNLLIIDDKSVNENTLKYLHSIQLKYKEKIHVIFNPINLGPGASRNIGVNFAQKHGFSFILFMDADDISHESRVNVCREIFKEDINASVVYSTFSVIDENSNPVDELLLSPSIREILNSHKVSPPQGEHAWIDIGTTTGYTNLTSSTAVRTELAVAYPFPKERVSEDMHTWLRYSAGGSKFVFTSLIPTLYRIPQSVGGSSSRQREGGIESFYTTKARVDEDGFRQAFDIAVSKGKVTLDEYQLLMLRFHLKLAGTLVNVKQFILAREQINKAALISDEICS